MYRKPAGPGSRRALGLGPEGGLCATWVTDWLHAVIRTSAEPGAVTCRDAMIMTISSLNRRGVADGHRCSEDQARNRPPAGVLGTSAAGPVACARVREEARW